MERSFDIQELLSGKIKSNGVVVYFGNTVGRVERNYILRHYNCQMGKITGRSGRCYIICVYRLNYRDQPSVPVVEKDFIMRQIKEFYTYAAKNPDMQFYVAYEALDAIFSGYSMKEMADFFSTYAIPDNVMFDKVFNCGIL